MEKILNYYRDRVGWNDQSVIDILCRYIENQRDSACFEEFVRRAAEEEEQLGDF